MTQHYLQGRTDKELMWFQRRGFLQAAAAWTAVGSLGGAHADTMSNIVELRGDAMVNGQALTPQQSIQTGDEITTGPGSTLIFVLGNSAFHVRQNSALSVGRGASLNAVSLLRLLTGAVVSVWGRGAPRQIMTPTLTAGIRGTGTYTEVPANQGGRSYFCNCYGVVELSSGPDKELSDSTHHQAYWGEGGTTAGSLTPALMINHSDQELEFLARLLGERTAWQISGKKYGTKAGSIY